MSINGIEYTDIQEEFPHAEVRFLPPRFDWYNAKSAHFRRSAVSLPSVG